MTIEANIYRVGEEKCVDHEREKSLLIISIHSDFLKLRTNDKGFLFFTPCGKTRLVNQHEQPENHPKQVSPETEYAQS